MIKFIKELSKIAFRKGGLFILDLDKMEKKSIPDPIVIHFNRELLQLGYTLPENALYILDEKYIKTWGKSLLEYLHEFLGHETKWIPFYKNFPNDVKSMSDTDLLLFQMKHYLDGWEPDALSEDVIKNINIYRDSNLHNLCEDAEVLELFGKEEIISKYENTLEMNQSIPPIDTEAIKFLKNNLGWNIKPSNIPFKENLAVYLSIYGKSGLGYCSSINDVLRGIMCSLEMSPVFELPKKIIKNAWGHWMDNSLERQKKNFPSIPRKKRKIFLALLEEYLMLEGVKGEDIKKQRNFWIKLGEKLHPGDYKEEYPFAYDIFNTARNKKIRSFGTRLHESYKENNQDNVLKVLSERPGEFFRRFDSLYRREGFSKTKTLNALVELKNAPSTKIILELMEHLERRTSNEYTRKIKTVDSRDYFVLPKLDPLSKEDVHLVRDYFYMLLIENYEKQESLLGKTVVIGNNIEDVRLPKDMRTVSESLKVVGRGTAFNIPEGIDYIRAYSYWNDKEGNMDLDLYATFLSEDFEKTINIGWNQSFREGFSCHSGDVRNRIGDCAEYIDIDIPKALESGMRYVCIDVLDYQGVGFSNIPNNKAGICAMKEIPENGILDWKPSGNIIQAFTLNTTGSGVLAQIIDLKERKVYFVDEDLTGLPVGNYHRGTKVEILKSYVQNPVISVKKLIELNSIARGAKVISEEDFASIENPILDDYIFYKKDDIIKDFSVVKDLIG